MKGYDEFNTILLPPRQPADKLPQELLDYYEGLFNDCAQINFALDIFFVFAFGIVSNKINTVCLKNA